MPSLKEVRTRITSTISTQQITSAMKMVSASKLRRAQDAIIQMRPYAGKLKDILSNITSSLEASAGGIYAKEKPVKKVLLVAITSNRGLCGAFNSNVLRAVNALLEGKYAEQNKEGHVKVLCIGKKASDFFSKNKKFYAGHHNELFNDLSFANTAMVAEEIMKEYIKGDMGNDEDANVRTKTGGTISRVLVSVGDNVSAGQLIAETDNRTIVQEISEVQKSLSASKKADPKELESLEKKLELLQEQLEGTKIKSLISGHITSLNIKVGEVVAQDTIVAHVHNSLRTYDRVDIIYNQFKNAASQLLTTEQYLPVTKPEADTTSKKRTLDYIFEPGKEEIVKDLIPNALKIQLYKALLDSHAAEHGARMTSMHKATDNANEILRDLRLTYNKARQATITKEILEIVGGAEALKN
jgi:ATP synthase F1 gamma subunit